ncbi:MAG: hypothetical protein ACMG6H_08720, partial [Acidobacteriota bacterium]
QHRQSQRQHEPKPIEASQEPSSLQIHCYPLNGLAVIRAKAYDSGNPAVSSSSKKNVKSCELQQSLAARPWSSIVRSGQ